MPKSNRHRGRRSRRGSVIVASLLAVVLMSGMAAALLTIGITQAREIDAGRRQTQALYLAQSGVSESIHELVTSVKTGEPVGQRLVVKALSAGELEESLGVLTGADAGDAIEVATLGEDAPRALPMGSYWANLWENANGTWTIVSSGETRGQRRALEVVVEPISGGIYDNALFAGNSSQDPFYSFELGGSGGQADQVRGDVYCGGGVAVEGDASVVGNIRASGSVYGADGQEGVSQPIPDIAGMDYENSNDYDVLAMFLEDSRWRSDNAGGRAYQLPSSSPGHIFRMDPSDRRSETRSTEKHDFFLEDPYESVRVDSGQTGSDPYQITLTGLNGRPGENGSEKVYFIDGNLWVHNKKTYSFMFKHYSNEDVRITFVVKGNVYFSDNVFLQDDQKDGIAFVAIEDAEVEDSGNIYFGDPEFGTLMHMQAYMYAENNFYDYNLDERGSAHVSVLGNMTAGNHVEIERDYHNQHTKLTVEFDDRVSTGELQLPGLPGQDNAAEGYRVVSWRELATL